MTPSDESVSHWIDGLKAGDEAATAKLWQRYFRRLMGLARKKLGASPKRAADEEDVAISAFQSFCQGAKEDRFPDLRDRDDLWRLVVCITERKAHTQARDLSRKKRGAGLVVGESAVMNQGASQPAGGIDDSPGPEPTPEFVAEMAEAVDGLFEQLADGELQRIALLKLEGYKNEEIAQEIGRALPTVERRLKLIRQKWSRGLANA
jgi:DNA-directed RNA polymerase specialized sigma24 family protein